MIPKIISIKATPKRRWLVIFLVIVLVMLTFGRILDFIRLRILVDEQESTTPGYIEFDDTISLNFHFVLALTTVGVILFDIYP